MASYAPCVTTRARHATLHGPIVPRERVSSEIRDPPVITTSLRPPRKKINSQATQTHPPSSMPKENINRPHLIARAQARVREEGQVTSSLWNVKSANTPLSTSPATWPSGSRAALKGGLDVSLLVCLDADTSQTQFTPGRQDRRRHQSWASAPSDFQLCCYVLLACVFFKDRIRI